MCPKNCEQEALGVAGDSDKKLYTVTSPMCKAAIHASLINGKENEIISLHISSE